MTCTTVAVGDDCDFQLLQEIARIGNGRYYHAEDPSNIPQIFAKETVTASQVGASTSSRSRRSSPGRRR